MNPYREQMARYERDEHGYVDRTDEGREYPGVTEGVTIVVGATSCSEEGMNHLAALSVLWDEHEWELMEWLHWHGSEKCGDGVALALHEWTANDYMFEPGEWGWPCFTLGGGFHDDGNYCIAWGYEVTPWGGRFFDWNEGYSVAPANYWNARLDRLGVPG